MGKSQEAKSHQFTQRFESLNYNPKSNHNWVKSNKICKRSNHFQITNSNSTWKVEHLKIMQNVIPDFLLDYSYIYRNIYKYNNYYKYIVGDATWNQNQLMNCSCGLATAFSYRKI